MLMYVAPRARGTRLFAMRMNDHRRPMGIGQRKLTMTSAMAISHPLNTTGTEVTMMLGSKNRWRNLLEFHAFAILHAEPEWTIARPETRADHVERLIGGRHVERRRPPWYSFPSGRRFPIAHGKSSVRLHSTMTKSRQAWPRGTLP